MTATTTDRRVVLVTGASRGIGAAVAAAFADTGAHVLAAARDAAALDRVVAGIAAAGGSASSHPLDVTDSTAVRRLLEEVADRYGRLDAAVNNAGGSTSRPKPLPDWSAEEFGAAVDANLTGTFLCLKHELALMLRTGGGAIVNMSSTAGQQAVAGLAGYVASKHAVEGLTRVAALDHAAAGIRVNALAPGPVLTERLAGAGPQAQAATAAAVPLQRLGTPDEVARAAVWLCSPESSFVTGTTLTIDGGRLAGILPPRRPG